MLAFARLTHVRVSHLDSSTILFDLALVLAVRFGMFVIVASGTRHMEVRDRVRATRLARLLVFDMQQVFRQLAFAVCALTALLRVQHIAQSVLLLLRDGRCHLRRAKEIIQETHIRISFRLSPRDRVSIVYSRASVKYQLTLSRVFQNCAVGLNTSVFF